MDALPVRGDPSLRRRQRPRRPTPPQSPSPEAQLAGGPHPPAGPGSLPAVSGAGPRRNLTDLEGFLRACAGRSLLDLLDQVGTARDELRPLRRLARGSAYSAKYLGLRATQEELPAVKISGDWQSSERALQIYGDIVA